MNVTEGAKRMMLAGRWIVAAGLLIWLLSMLVRASDLFNLGNLPLGVRFLLNDLFNVLALSIPIALAGGVLWLAGWIIEGFAKEAD